MVTFEIFKGNDGQYYFHIIAANGQKIAQSEGYTRKESIRDTIATIRKAAATAEVIDHT